MGTIGSALLKLLLDSLIATFGKFLIDVIEIFRIEHNARAAGRAETEAEQARIGREVAEDMAKVSDDIDVAQRLRDGTA